MLGATTCPKPGINFESSLASVLMRLSEGLQYYTLADLMGLGQQRYALETAITRSDEPL